MNVFATVHLLFCIKIKLCSNLKHASVYDLNSVLMDHGVMDRDGWSGKSLIINILLPFHICV